MTKQGESSIGRAGDAASQPEPATGEVTAMWSPGMAAALRALHGPRAPMTPEEVAAFESAKARVQAEDERRRAPQPQLDLDAAA